MKCSLGPEGGLEPLPTLHKCGVRIFLRSGSNGDKMNSPLIQLLVLAGVAVFLILKLKNVLGTRDGFEGPVQAPDTGVAKSKSKLEVIDGGPDHDIIDNVDEGSDLAKTLSAMKRLEPSFSVTEFLQGARGAYEMILIGFERGDLAGIKPFLANDVYETFAEVVEDRAKQGLSIESDFIGIRELKIVGAELSPSSNIAEISVKFVGELTTVVRDRSGEIIQGKPNEVVKQKDVWTFARVLGIDDPNWELVATGE